VEYRYDEAAAPLDHEKAEQTIEGIFRDGLGAL
jgi:hypothetical protein